MTTTKEPAMDITIKDKVVVVTGAARGIGRALALGLAAEGARVAVVARDLDRAQAVVDEITALEGVAGQGASAAFAVAADVSDDDQVAAAATRIDEHFGRVDALVNNAGFMPGRTPLLDLDVALLHRVLDSNLVSGFVTTKHFAPLMIRGGGGRIVYLSSIAAVQVTAGGPAYSAAKAGVNVLTTAAHHEFAQQGIRTVAIAPGLTDTPGMRDIITPEHLARTSAAYPGGRLGQPDDLVGLVVYLCSDAAEHLSGTVVTVRPAVS